MLSLTTHIERALCTTPALRFRWQQFGAFPRKDLPESLLDVVAGENVVDSAFGEGEKLLTGEGKGLR